MTTKTRVISRTAIELRPVLAAAETPPPTQAVPPQRSRGRKRRNRKATQQDSSETPGRGKKKSRKQMAYVGAVYTIAPFPRTVDDVMDEIARRDRAQDRPRPQNKRVWAEMTPSGGV